MAHIHTQPGQHDHTASGIIIRMDFTEPKLLLHRHRLLGKYLQFGGHVELDETPWQTVIRELREESGYEIAQLKILQPKVRIKKLSGSKMHPVTVSVDTHNFSPDHFHTDMKYVFVTFEEPKHKIKAEESADFRLLSRVELDELNDQETFNDIKEIGDFIFDHVLSSWQAVDPALFVI
jgi:8-oxo-dGTP pyrophosphatase MutT (NUDIX family)